MCVLLKDFPNNRINLYWIPSHIGIQGNEEADILAKTATNDNECSLAEVPYTDLYQCFKKQAKVNVHNQIIEQSLSKGTVFFELFFRKSKLPWFSDKKLSRSQIVTINRGRANHYHLAASLNRIGIVESPVCKCGLANEDLNHVLWQCTIYEEQRKKLVEKLHSQKFSIMYKKDQACAKYLQYFCRKPEKNLRQIFFYLRQIFGTFLAQI